MRPLLIAAITVILPVASAAAQRAPQRPETVVRVDASAMARLGVHVARLEPARVQHTISGYGRALDVDQLAALDAEISMSRATAMASAAEASRLARLASEDQAASARSVEAARAQSQADAARATLAERRIGLEFGPGLAHFGPRGRAQLIAAAAAGRAALLRIDFSDPSALNARRILIRVSRQAPTIVASPIGAAANADARLQSVGLLAVVRGSSAASLPGGRVFVAVAETNGSGTGVIVPREALVRYHGKVWAYLQTSPNTFMRREVADARLEDGGWFVSSGMRPGDLVAVEGAGSLLAFERGGEAGPD